MALTEKALLEIKHDSNLRAKIMLVEGKSEYTIKRWVTNNNDELTKPKYTDIISSHTGLKLNDIVQLQTAQA